MTLFEFFCIQIKIEYFKIALFIQYVLPTGNFIVEL